MQKRMKIKPSTGSCKDEGVNTLVISPLMTSCTKLVSQRYTNITKFVHTKD